jgi:hypothetical protein
MIVALAKNVKGGHLLIIGLDDRNVAALTAGKPALLNLKSVGIHELGDITVAIEHGKTYEDIAAKLREAGMDLPVMPNPEPGVVQVLADHRGKKG